MVAHRKLQLVLRDVFGRGDVGYRASLEVVQDRSEEQIMSRLLELENGGQSERRVRLRGERYLTLLHDPDSGRSYVLRHGTDETEGAEIPEGSEFEEYPTSEGAQRAFELAVQESRQSGELVEEDSTDDIGDFETQGAEIRDLYSDQDEDELTRDPVISEEEEP
jgi:hypothetical protein